MPTFFGIYSKNGKADIRAFEAAFEDFSLNGTRKIIKKVFEGFAFCFVEKFEKCRYENDHTLSFVSGHISFNYTQYKAQSVAQGFSEQFLKKNTNCFAELEGAFAAVSYDAQTHELVLVNDKFGIFPLFIYENNDYLVFSSEYQPLFQSLLKKDRHLNLDAVAEFFTLGVILGTKTFFKNIHDLAPAHYLKIRGKQKTYERYWHYKPPAMIDSTNIIARTILDTLTTINREYLDAGHTELCLLSAGADSRLIIATMTEKQRQESGFYTSNLSFLDPTEDKDVIGAVQLKNKFGLNHKVEKISFYENQFDKAYFENERRLRKKNVYGGWHGGEFLGGYFLNTAPVKSGLQYKEVDKRLRSVFHWAFRLKLSRHPYWSYQLEKNAHPCEHVFFINQLTNGFFTSVYGGTKGHWVQPYQLTIHGLSPFWDSRFLQQLLQVPIDQLSNYTLYNEVFKHCKKEFTEVPSNSPLTSREDSVIKKMDTGIEPKNKVPNTHHQSYLENRKDISAGKKWFYNKGGMEKIVSEEFNEVTGRWLDFEVWLNYINSQKGEEKNKPYYNLPPE